MMKKLLAKLISAGMIAAMALAAFSCKPQDEAKDAVVSLKITGTSESSISFEITAENAVSVAYAVFPSDAASGDYQTVQVQGSSPLSITEDGLSENTEYTVSAYGINADGKAGAKAEETAVTSAAPSVRIEISEKTSSSVKFVISPLNAVSVEWTVAESSSDLEAAELTEKAEGGQEQELSEDGLSENTNYTIIAEAVNAAGNRSGRVFESFKTETEPVVSISSIEAEYNQAHVSIVSENAAKYAYAAVKKGEPEPEKGNFMERQFENGSSATFIVSQLEPSAEYVLYLYGINSRGYAGKTVSEDFVTEEYVQMPFEIKVSNVTSTDADIDVTFDKEQYSGYYFVLGSSAVLVPSAESWDWNDVISDGFSVPMYVKYEEEMSCRLRTWTTEFFLYPETVYMAGGVPVLPDGTLDTDAAVWQAIDLPKLVFGESNVTAGITEKITTMDAITYSIDVDDPNIESVYVNYQAGTYYEGSSDAESLARSSIITGIPLMSGSFNKDTVQAYLQPGSDYTMFAIPKDSEGRLGKITCLNFSTKPLDYVGDAKGTAEVSVMDVHEAVFDIQLGENAVKMLYKYESMYLGFDEEWFVQNLKVNNYNSISQDGEFRIENLTAEKEYIFGFVPVDENGICGQEIVIYESTAAYDYDGNPEADVQVEIISCEFDGWSYATSIKAVPNEYVSKYYVGVKSQENPYFSNGEFIDQCMAGWTVEYTSAQIIENLYSSVEATLLVAVYDKDGKISKVKEVVLEDTF